MVTINKFTYYLFCLYIPISICYILWSKPSKQVEFLKKKLTESFMEFTKILTALVNRNRLVVKYGNNTIDHLQFKLGDQVDKTAKTANLAIKIIQSIERIIEADPNVSKSLFKDSGTLITLIGLMAADNRLLYDDLKEHLQLLLEKLDESDRQFVAILRFVIENGINITNNSITTEVEVDDNGNVTYVEKE